MNLEPEPLERIASAGEIESYDPGETIVAEGSLGDALFLIRSSSVDRLADWLAGAMV